MMNIIVVDARNSFLDDINTRILLDDHNVEIVSTLNSAENLHNAISVFRPDIVAISENIVETQRDWSYADAVIVGYAITPDGKELFKKYSLPCYGVIKNTAHLLNLLEGPVPARIRKEEKQEVAPPVVEDTYAPQVPQNIKQEYNSGQQMTARISESETPDEVVFYTASAVPKMDNDNRPTDAPVQGNTTFKSFQHNQSPDVEQESKREENAPTQSSSLQVSSGGQVRSQLQKIHEQKKSEYNEAAMAKESLDRDLYRMKQPAKVVTVYAAKGGVGKTTISKEVAANLALTEHGRGRYRTCIVDYNIDFGDVRSTLGLDNEGVDMCIWAMDIKDRIQNGETPSEINYSRKEIESYLQVMDKVGLYALCAPNTHEESMEIGQNELEVMLRNITHNGGFDFVVCDTGNNTRDSSFCALESADYVLLVVTQDVNAASCNKSAIETFEAIGFDMSKIRLILNNAMSVKYTGLHVKDVEDYFDKFPCVARIKHNMDVIKSNNFSQPIVLQPNHEITKELRNVIAFLTNNEGIQELPVKKGFFSRFKKK